MPDQIYIVDPTTNEPVKVKPVTFHDIGVTERYDLERWVARDPGLLGEPLLAITTEFSAFDKSNRRVDILALDAGGRLVVVELKLDAGGSLADQQAIRYAALCSNMKMENVIDELVVFEGCAREEAANKIKEFLKVDKLPKLEGNPRIILAAGSMEDHELTTCVLWLRGFAIDISCIELTPYQMPDSSQVVVVPRTIIPVPEMRNYLISVKHRGAKKVKKLDGRYRRAAFWKAVAKEFNKLGTDFRASGHASGGHMCIKFGSEYIQYEWIVRKKDRRLDIALHFEFSDRQESLEWLDKLKTYRAYITDSVEFQFDLVPWGQKWSEARFRLPFEGEFPNDSIVPIAANAMKLLVERTWPVIRSCID